MQINPTLPTLILALTSQLSISSQILFSSTPYIETFDSLAASGSGVAWTDGATLAAWYSTRATYSAGTGSSTSGGLYSLGQSGSSERALGSLATGTITPIHFGLRLFNDTGSTINHVSVSYTGEQWRVGGASSVNNTLTFAYKVGAASLGESGYTDVASLSFDSPVDAAAAGSALNGNDSANRTAIAGALDNLAWNPGTELWLRWSDADNASSDHALAIDELSISAVPEPGSTGLLAAAVLMGFAFVKRYCKAPGAQPTPSRVQSKL